MPADISTFVYAPQRKKTTIRSEGESTETFDVTSLGGNSFKWFQYDFELTNEENSSLIVDINQNAKYRCEIKNSTYPDLTIETWDEIV